MIQELLQCFRQGARWLAQHAGWTVSLVILGTLLGTLAPYLQVRLSLPDTLEAQAALWTAATLPLACYAAPCFLVRVDAEARDRDENALARWHATFERRWLRALGTRLVLWVGVTLGLVALVVPGLMVLAAFGWAPTLVLLRDFEGPRAFRSSLRIMGAHGARVIFVFMGAFLAVQLLEVALVGAMPTAVAEGGPSVRLHSPWCWAEDALFTLAMLWMDMTLLALFHRVEAPAHAPEPEDPDQASK